MATIRLLDESIAQKIAAGEVVERPSSVVKELVENAIDAGSSFITVEIREGGISYLRVTDNGCGISADEVELAFVRHATSKIQSLDDLYNIRQMGFRGEALYSIAAVSKLEMITKPVLQPSGYRFVIHGGKKAGGGEFGCPDGTTIIVSDLFYNTPARLKFLNKPAAEAGSIGTVMMRLILANPGVSIKFVSNDKVLYHSTGDGNLMNAIYVIFGRDIARRLLAVEQTMGRMGVSGYLFSPQDTRGNRGSQYLMVNSRPVINQQISAIVERYFAGLSDSKRFPGYVLNVCLPPSDLDVNVHPNKLQVRFADDRQVKQLIEVAVSQAMEKYKSLPIEWSFPHKNDADTTQAFQSSVEMESANEPSMPAASVSPEFSVPSESGFRSGTTMEESVGALTESIRKALSSSYSGGGFPSIPQSLAQKPMVRAVQQPAQQETQPSLVDVKPVRIIGQLFSTYILVEFEDKLLIIDQHAAHERLLYDRYRRALEETGTCSQALLIPQTLSVSFEVKAVIDSNLELLKELGFDIEEYGKLGYQVRSVPFILGQPQIADLMIQIVDALSEDRTMRSFDLKREKIMSMSCKKAVKAGDSLTQSELQTLVALIAEEAVPLTCPHGRPFVITMDRHSMDRQFHRIK